MKRVAAIATMASTLGCLLLAPDVALACAGCRNPNMPVTRVNGIQLRPGELRAGLSLGATSAIVSHEAGCADPASCSETPVQPLFMHKQHILPAEVRALGELGLTAALGAELQVPFRLVRTSIRYTTPQGYPYQPLDPDVHHRNETLVGVGDVWLLGRWAGQFGGLMLSVRGGASLPIGGTEPNPFDLGDAGKRHQHIQFGSGTVDPILALDITKSLGRWVVSGYAQGQAALYENGHGYQAGLKGSVGAQAGRKVWRSLTGVAGLEGLYEGPERWDGRIRQDGNLGRTEALAALSLVQSFPKTTLGLSARVPVYRHIVAGDEKPGTFSSPLMVGLFVGRTLSVY